MPARYTFLFLAVALMVGVALGVAGSSFAYRHHWLRLRGESPIERMSRELKLTPAQTSAMHEIVQSTGAQVIELRRECEQQRTDLMADAYSQVRELLKPGQQHIFDRDFVPAALRAKVEGSARAETEASMTPAATPTAGIQSPTPTLVSPTPPATNRSGA